MKDDPKNHGFATRAIHAGQPPEATTGAVVVPIFQTSTYVHGALGEDRSFHYARGGNPTRRALEENVASLEGGVSGHGFASGMAAISALMTLLEAGDHVVVTRGVYGGTYRLFTRLLERTGLTFSWVDTTRAEEVERALRPTTRMVFLETPTNPRLEITDVRAVAEIAHAHGAVVAMDNTFLTPYLQRPLELGADVVVHSTTKFLNGHSDSLGGVLVASRADHTDWFALVQKSAGGVLAPFEAFLILRGIKTLAVRMAQHEANAERIASFLAEHPKVARVYYPGLPDHPGHAVQVGQSSGFGAMISIELGDYAAAKTFLDRLRVMSLAESLGGVETLVSHPATMANAAVPPERRKVLGVGDNLVRISVGIEEIDDLLEDLDQALDGI